MQEWWYFGAAQVEFQHIRLQSVCPSYYISGSDSITLWVQTPFWLVPHGTPAERSCRSRDVGQRTHIPHYYRNTLRLHAQWRRAEENDASPALTSPFPGAKTLRKRKWRAEREAPDNNGNLKDFLLSYLYEYYYADLLLWNNICLRWTTANWGWPLYLFTSKWEYFGFSSSTAQPKTCEA